VKTMRFWAAIVIIGGVLSFRMSTPVPVSPAERLCLDLNSGGAFILEMESKSSLGGPSPAELGRKGLVELRRTLQRDAAALARAHPILSAATLKLALIVDDMLVTRTRAAFLRVVDRFRRVNDGVPARTCSRLLGILPTKERS